MDLTIPISQQILELERELMMRKNVYPGLIAKGKLLEEVADARINTLEAAIESLRRLEESGKNQLTFTGWPE